MSRKTAPGSSVVGSLALAGSGGVVYALCFPPWNLPWYAWVGLLPLLLALRRAPGVSRAIASGWVFGAAATLVASGWTAPSLVAGFDLPWSVAALFTAGTMVVYGAFFAAFGALAVALRRGALPTAVGIAAAWPALELLRARLFGGMPWLLLGHSQWDVLPVLQWAEWIGVLGISALLALVNGCVAEAAGSFLEGARRRALVHAAAAATIVAIVFGAGALRLAQVESETGGESFRIAVVQAALPQSERWLPAWRLRNLERHLELTREAVARGADLVVWGETAIDFELEEMPDLPQRIAAALGGSAERQLLAGLPRRQPADGGVARMNSVALFDGAGRVLGFYDKVRLLPFAESDPAWLRYAPPVRRWLAPLLEGDAYTPGADSKPIATRFAPAGALVCFESIYPDLSRATVLAGAEILVNVTNDGFFVGRAPIEQHYAMTVFRAVETRRPLARAANGGIGALIAPSGRARALLPPDEPRVVVEEIRPRRGETLYVRAGYVLPHALAALGIVGLVPVRRRPAARTRKEG